MITTRQPRHPGALIKRQYLEPLKMTITELASLVGISQKTLSEIINEREAITPDIALRLATAFQTTPQLWLNLQQNYDLWCAANSSDEWRNIKPIEL
jgi:addiction module HigA family antidote